MRSMNVVAAGILAGWCLLAADAESGSAKANLMTAKGGKVGSAVLIETPRGVLLQVDVSGLTPGEHGFHIHETGKCEAPKFESAGGHYAPRGKSHGFHDAKGQHAGDLANLMVGQSGSVKQEMFVEGVRLSGGEAPLLRSGGTALVIHAGRDDHRTDPAGDSGDRVACGVIVAGK